jgi:hypothetical protein
MRMTVRDVCFRSLAGTADIVRIILSSSQTESTMTKVSSSGYSPWRLARKGYANVVPICDFHPTRRTNRCAATINVYDNTSAGGSAKIETKLAEIDRLKYVSINPL